MVTPPPGSPRRIRFQPEPVPGYSGNLYNNRHRVRRAPTNGADADGWIDTNELRQRGVPSFLGRRRNNPRANLQQEFDNEDRRVHQSVTDGNNLNEERQLQHVELPPGGFPVLPIFETSLFDNHNWTLVRLFSEEIYSVFEKQKKFNEEYLSKEIAAEIFYEKTMDGEYSRDVFSVGVNVKKVLDIFRFGQTGARLTLEGSLFPKAVGSPLDKFTLTAKDELAELLHMVVQPGDFLQIFGGNHLRSSAVVHLNINSSGKILVVHYKHNAIFSPLSADGKIDVYNRIKDPRFIVVMEEESDMEHKVVIKPAGPSREQPATEEAAGHYVSIPRNSQLSGVSCSPLRSIEIVNIEQDKSSECQPTPQKFHPRKDEKSKEPDPNDVLSADMFEQSFSLSSGQSSGKTKPNPTPDACDSTDDVMRALCPEDNPISASHVNNPISTESPNLHNRYNSIQMQEEDCVPSNNLVPISDAEKDKEYNSILADLQDSEPEEVAAMESQNEFRDSLEHLDNVNQPVSADLPNTPDLLMGESLNKENGIEEAEIIPTDENTPEDSDVTTEDSKNNPVPIYSNAAETQYFDEEGNSTTPGPSNPHPSEDQPPPDVSPGRFKRKKKIKRKKKSKPIMKTRK